MQLKRIFLFAVLAVLCAVGQTTPVLKPALVTYTGTCTSTCVVQGINGYNLVNVQITGTYSVLALAVQGTNDNTNYTALSLTTVGTSTTQSSITANGLYQASVAGMTNIKYVVSSFTGTSVSIQATYTPAVARNGGASGAAGGALAGTYPNPTLAAIAANKVLANVTAGSAAPAAVTLPGCTDTAGNHLNYTNGTGFSCGNTGGSPTFPLAAPPGSATTPSYGFTGSGSDGSGMSYQAGSGVIFEAVDTVASGFLFSLKSPIDSSVEYQIGCASGVPITNATNASPIVITLASVPLGLAGYNNGSSTVISGVGGNTAANGTFVITAIDSTHFSLNGSTGNGAYTSGGTSSEGCGGSFIMTGSPAGGGVKRWHLATFNPGTGSSFNIYQNQMQFQHEAATPSPAFVIPQIGNPHTLWIPCTGGNAGGSCRAGDGPVWFGDAADIDTANGMEIGSVSPSTAFGVAGASVNDIGRFFTLHTGNNFGGFIFNGLVYINNSTNSNAALATMEVATTSATSTPSDRFVVRTSDNVCFSGTGCIQITPNSGTGRANITATNANGLDFQQTNATGTTQSSFRMNSANGIQLGVGGFGTFQWNINSSGNFVAVTDNTNDIGASGATRPRNIYVGTAVQYGEVPAPLGTAGAAPTWADSGDHMFKYNPNNGGEQHVPQVYRLTAQYTNSTTGFTTVGTPNIAFPVNANQSYIANCVLYYQAAATGGLNIEFTGPASPTVVRYDMDLPTALTGVASVEAGSFGTSIGAVSTNGASDLGARVSFSLINGANAGTVTLLAKSSASVQLQIQTGSFCQVQ